MHGTSTDVNVCMKHGTEPSSLCLAQLCSQVVDGSISHRRHLEYGRRTALCCGESAANQPPLSVLSSILWGRGEVAGRERTSRTPARNMHYVPQRGMAMAYIPPSCLHLPLLPPDIPALTRTRPCAECGAPAPVVCTSAYNGGLIPSCTPVFTTSTIHPALAFVPVPFEVKRRARLLLQTWCDCFWLSLPQKEGWLQPPVAGGGVASVLVVVQSHSLCALRWGRWWWVQERMPRGKG